LLEYGDDSRLHTRDGKSTEGSHIVTKRRKIPRASGRSRGSSPIRNPREFTRAQKMGASLASTSAA
jgi:hypothetical protein